MSKRFLIKVIYKVDLRGNMENGPLEGCTLTLLVRFNLSKSNWRDDIFLLLVHNKLYRCLFYSFVRVIFVKHTDQGFLLVLYRLLIV